MGMFLQLWGGLFYLISKILLAQKSPLAKKRGWVIYSLGVPPWLVIFALEHNWIALALEAGGLPSMVLGAIKIQKNWVEIPRKIDLALNWFIAVLLVVGVSYSMYEFHGIKTAKQSCEIGITVGFLFGTLALAKGNRIGWIWFMLMHTSAGALLAIQNRWILVALQAISFGFAVYGFQKATKKS